MDINNLKAELIRDEGLNLELYKCTSNKVTIGVGRNLTDRGITNDEAMLLLNNDISICEDELDIYYPWWRSMPDSAQRGLVNMMFNMGRPTLSKFSGMLACLESGDYIGAAANALDSRWASQVGDRSKRVAELFKEAANVE